MTLLKIVLLFLLLSMIHILWKRRKYYLLALKIKGPWGYPIFGMAHKLIRKEEILSILGTYEKKFGNSVFFSWFCWFPVLIVTEPQIAQDILTSPNCVNKGFMYNVVNDCTGDGLFSLKDPEWSRHRKLLNIAFNHKVLTSFMPIFNEETNKLINTLNGYCEKGEINIFEILRSATLAIATRTTMGRDVSIENGTNDVSLIDCYQSALDNMSQMCFSPWLKFTFVRCLLGIYGPYERAKREIKLFINNLIDQKIHSTYQQFDNKNTFINLALDLLKRGDFNYKNVEDESNVMVFGAFETTTNTIAYTLMLLAMFPIYQQKLYDEIKNVFTNSCDFDVTIADTRQLVYMDMVLKESMRIMAPVPIIAREVTSETKLSNGITLPAGTQIAIDIFNMQRRDDIWGTDSHKFSPDNFLPSNLQGKHAFAFIPFTKGIRNCIGWRYALLSVKVVLAKLIKNYHFKTTFNFNDLHFVEDVTLKLQKVPLLEIRRRNNTA